MIILLGLILAIALSQAFSRVIEEKGKTYIVDRHGERWDVTQARSLGFIQERFQHGIGRNAFTPLDDSSLKDNSHSASKSLRVIGISDGKQANAYSVPRKSPTAASGIKKSRQPTDRWLTWRLCTAVKLMEKL